ncbi:hypothetical protein P872_01155 [Rhodonellum psychrophilum GCM71 = DSM 17998]|uniref:POTRA domain-containing protein n=2 Tax=Rhodonellum TaxID=336827 RepID=U5C4R3_9BACT|nr:MULTISPECIES: POTRA domain-containing protein [Rhodonellum]ERM83896.1 hypothetical protein P872_01155 [Rhodonellum psychrophilum GCM71 = DSM 17998]SDZ04544.1 Surface antigen variable number repeat-containing protein [Rhodonellum ikkaensis]
MIKKIHSIKFHKFSVERRVAVISVYKKFLVFIVSAWMIIPVADTYAQIKEDTVNTTILDIPQKVLINNIFIVGNEKTRKNIILRELNLKQGLVYDWEELLGMIKADQQKIYNLQLFNNVEITPLLTEVGQIEILVSVTERWYIIPSIIFNLADRNFAEWWTNQNRDFSRVDYGLRLAHNNVGGRNEKMKISAQLGFTKAFDVLYSIPYIDKNQQHGLAVQFNYFTNKTVALRSLENKQVFFQNETQDALRKNTAAFLRYTYRGSFYNFHFATFGFNHTWVKDEVLEQNPNYFLNEQNDLRYFLASYNFRHDRRDNNAYATDGESLNIGITKYGLFSGDGINETELSLNVNKYQKFNNKFHYAAGLSLNAFMSPKQPYTLVRGIGYKPNFIRGYELNVIEGQQTVVQKNSLRFTIFDLGYDISNIMPVEEFSYFPVKLYFSANFDHGYVKDRNFIPENGRLTNQYLYGYGAGFDLVTFYDLVLRFEYSINSQKEGTFFINFLAPF